MKKARKKTKVCGGACSITSEIKFSEDDRPSVHLAVTPLWQCCCHRITTQFSGVLTIDKIDVYAKGQGQWSSSRSQRSTPCLAVSGLEFTYGDEMMHKAWCGIWEVPYCFSRSSLKFQGHTGRKIDDFDPNWALPDCNSSFKSQMATKWWRNLN